MKRKGKELFWAVAFALAAALLLRFAGAILRPSHGDYGSTWRAYLQEPRDSIDVLFLGSSYAYCDWNPGILYDESGLTSYVMGGSEQTPEITYYYLREALKTQTPSVVVLESTNVFFDQYQNYTQINLGYMPWGLNRVRAILECAQPELRLGLFFDLYFYHDRWKEITLEDVKQALSRPKADHLKGHTAMDKVYTGKYGPYLRRFEQQPQVYNRHMEAIGRIGRLCEQRGIDLILVVNPTFSQCTVGTYRQLEEDAAQAVPKARFFNWSNAFEQFGLEGFRHLADGGHLNREGAEIFSAATGRFLRQLGYEPRPQTEENKAAWRETAEFWKNS